MSDEARKRRAETWKRFAEEPGGLLEMLNGMTEHRLERLEYEDLETLHIDGVIGELRAVAYLRDEVRAIINTGKVDASEQAAQAEIATGKRKAFH